MKKVASFGKIKSDSRLEWKTIPYLGPKWPNLIPISEQYG